MAAVEQRGGGHDPHWGRTESTDSLNRELDWLIEKDEQQLRKEAEQEKQDQQDPEEELETRGASDDVPPEIEQKTEQTSKDKDVNKDENKDEKSSSQQTKVEREHDSSSTPDGSTGDKDSSSEPDLDTPRSTEDEDREKHQKMRGADTHYPRAKSPTGSPRASPRRMSLEKPEGDADGKSDDDDEGAVFEASDDQKQAMKELQEMMLDLAYTADEEPPEYDVTERVRKLNEELAREPTPDEDERERSIKFKDNLVDLVAPPPEDFSDEEEVKTEKGDGDASQAAAAGAGTQSKDSTGPAASSQQSQSGDKNEEKVLVHRNGKFELLSAKDLTAEEREMYLGPQTANNDAQSDSSNTPRSVDSAPEQRTFEPRPPAKQRPHTANGTSSRRGGSASGGTASKRRAQSAKTYSDNPNTDMHDFNYNSPYAITPEERKRMAKEQKEKDQKQKKEEEEEKKEKERKKEDGNDAFRAWLKNKRDEQSRQRKQERDEEKKREGDNDSESKKEMSFDDWVSTKKDQKQKEKEIEEQQRKEAQEAAVIHSRKECDKAFKEWLRKKREDRKQQEMEDRQRGRVHRLLARRSRKSQALARAISQSQSFRYVDYYGYRC